MKNEEVNEELTPSEKLRKRVAEECTVLYGGETNPYRKKRDNSVSRLVKEASK